MIEALLPNRPRDVPRVDDRRVLNGIFSVLRSGVPWRYQPEHYGPRTTCCNRFARRRKAGVWDRMMDAITAAHDGLQMIDSTSVRAHQQAATVKKGGGREIIVPVVPEVDSRPKSMRVVDGQGLPIRLSLTAGQSYNGQTADDLLGHVGAGTIVLADKAYDADRIRASLRERGAFVNIPPKSNRRSKPYFSTWLYRERNLIERFFSKLKHFRRVATRYDKLAENFLAMVRHRFDATVAARL